MRRVRRLRRKSKALRALVVQNPRLRRGVAGLRGAARARERIPLTTSTTINVYTTPQKYISGFL